MSTPEARLSEGARPVRGPLVIARHGKPALDRTAGPKLGWREYVDWWARYEEGSLAPGQDAPQQLRDAVADAVVHLASPRPRAVETARLAAPGAVLVTDPVFCEAPLPPPRFSRLKVLPKTWNVLARTAWSFGHSLEGSETIAQSRERAQAAALRLHEEALRGKVFLAAHGWFNRMLRPELKRLGWRCVADGGDSYWSARVYEYRGRHEKAD